MGEPVEPFCVGWEFPLMQLRPDLDPEKMKKPKAGRRQEHDLLDLLAAIADTSKDEPITISAWAEAADVPRQTLTEYLPQLRVKGWIATIGDGKAARQYITKAGRKECRK